MPATLLLFLPDLPHFEAGTPLDWLRLEGESATRGRSTPGESPMAERVLAVAPVARILYLETALPPVSVAKRNALLNYAIEDKLTIDPDTVHAVVQGRTHDEEHLVAVVDRRWLSAAIAWLAGAGRMPSALVCEAESVAARSGEWVVVPGVPHGFFRRADGFVSHLDSARVAEVPFALTLALSEARAKQQAPAAIEVVAASADAGLAAAWQQSLEVPVRLGAARPERERAEALVAAARTQNLLTGSFAPRTASSPLGTIARRAGVLVGAMVLVQWGGTALDNARMNAERERIEAGLKDRFRAVFPDAQTIVDAPLQMKRKLADLKRDRGLGGADAARAALDRLSAFVAKPADGIASPELMSVSVKDGVAAMRLRVAEAAQLAPLMGAAEKIEGAKAQKVDEPSARQTIVSLRATP